MIQIDGETGFFVDDMTALALFVDLLLPFRFEIFPVETQALIGRGGVARAGQQNRVVELTETQEKLGIILDYFDENMNAYTNEVLGSIAGAANRNFSTFYSSVGLTLGKEGRTNYIFEVLLPSFFLTGNNFSLTDTDYYSGFRLSVQFPVNKK